jgi:RNA-directed DNA polymerase
LQEGQYESSVPTCLDRLIQQAIAQVLTPIFGPGFSGSSSGFRPGRSARRAVRVARRCIADGLVWVVDIDLDRFVDRVQFGVLMARAARKVDDRKILKLIRSYLEAGVMAGGIKQATAEGTPQGSPLSPVVSDVMLDDLDRGLRGRGHRFVRYADGLRVFVRSERAAQRVFESVCGVIERRLKLKVNREKSSIRHAARATLLGFGLFFDGPRAGIRIAPKAIRRPKDQPRMLTRRRWSVSVAYRIGRPNRLITGWMAYFRLAQRVSVPGKLDGWLRRRLRQIRWKEWKTTAAKRHNLRIRGISERGGPEMGRCQQEILEGRRLPDPPGIPAQLILAPPRPEDPEPDLAAFQPNGLTNRRMRTRTPGGARGGGATPPPTRFS